MESKGDALGVERLPLNRQRVMMLACFALATIALIAIHGYATGVWAVLAGALGILAAAGCAVVAWKDPESAVGRRMSVLLGCVVLLGICDINSSTKNENFLYLGGFFFLVVCLPIIILKRTDPGVIRYRFWPRRFSARDIIYTLISIPLAWAVLEFYWQVNPDLHRQWTMPPEADPEEIKRLFIGINLVGIWDELFFVNTVFAVLRSLFAYRWANALQAVVYTSVLFDMAFIGIGPVIILIFAWTQGAMYERSENLLFVLIVHLIVDFFLVAQIVSSYYPDYGYDYLWRHGF